MYQFSYAEIMEEGVAVSKDRERQVLDRSIALLKAAMASDGGNQSREAIEAIYFTRRVWIRFIEDLGDSENQLEAELRANLISIAIWILKEIEKIRKRESSNFQGIIDITTIIKDGIK
ncbi:MULTISPECIES: flagellar biosynthesis regulator FlaF [unclassified Shinella]|jgi:flagellar protein FlaF|uniref:flagellar biosynthesis regulator FlaF n=1 Tax=unclassified Shinella TaxID=2643062 RepID=UPI00043794A9|nr:MULTISPECIES: flagellar biosynthesis regulator FlaF [unclassified Shinella]EYR80392.1 flagellar biosynthesis regulator FlaF [Shinella sp. DD12]MCO5152787.1 flagellar biosynthesis regulator FlaF [Shinella sp.]MDC7260779.1 flagellar biosynthesis regulator FlaF [Shinella sp. HY16]MDC7267674.1 flagellar biosynthesis regulator FlaF [Shinella sp. YZ44]MDG4672265.1 flagellar biosynthesis regulator FlaF [Shinella sp. 838]